jgi:hypothetical protein
MAPSDAISISALVYSQLFPVVYPIKTRLGEKYEKRGRYIRRQAPNIFYSTSVCITHGIMDYNAIRGIVTGELVYISSLDAYTYGGSTYHPEDRYRVNLGYAQDDVPVDHFPDVICKLCLNGGAMCKECHIRDVFFCETHSSVIKTRKFDQEIEICYVCEDKRRMRLCNVCFIDIIYRCMKCNRDDGSRHCKRHTLWKKNIHGATDPNEAICKLCQDECTCVKCHEISMTTAQCHECSKQFCNSCNPVITVNLSPMVLYSGVQPAIAVYRKFCHTCLAGRTVEDIQNEERAKNGHRYKNNGTYGNYTGITDDTHYTMYTDNDQGHMVPVLGNIIAAQWDESNPDNEFPEEDQHMFW